MKKVIGVLSLSTFALAMFFSANTKINLNSNVNLADLLLINSAEAETTATGKDKDGNETTVVLCVDAPDDCEYSAGGVTFSVSGETLN